MTKQMVQAADLFFVASSLEQEKEDFREALKHPAMRRIIRRMLGVSNVMGPSRGFGDFSTAYNEGVRAVGLWVVAGVEHGIPGEVARLMLESAREREEMVNKQE